VLTSATEFVGGESSSEEAFSTNVGGYCTVALPRRVEQYVANQFDQPSQKVSDLFATLPSSSQLTYYDPAGTPLLISNPGGDWSGWEGAEPEIARGMAVHVYANAAVDLVMSGTLDGRKVTGAYASRRQVLTCSALPLEGDPIADMGAPEAGGDFIQIDPLGGSVTSRALSDGSWSDEAPDLRLGEGFIYFPSSARTWSQRLVIQPGAFELDVDFTP